MRRRLSKLFCGLLAAVAVGTVRGEEPVVRATRVDITSQPSGATVIVDGRDRGVTPLALFDLRPGRHLLKCRLAGYQESDRYFNVDEGVPVQRNAVLEPVKGILLLKTEPAGAKIYLDGVSLGETPRLVTTLNAKDPCKLVLRKAGYKASTIDVRFDGRTPLVREETLLLDSGVVTVTSDPAGARVTVNGIDRGVTPVVVEDVPKGIASVKIALDGFQEEIRELSLKAGDRPTLAVTLKGLPGTLSLSSVPEGARLYVNGKFEGKAPLVLPKLDPGEYEVRAELDGYGTETRQVTVGNGATPSVDFRLSNTMGRIEIRSTPPGATVFFDGKTLGVTKSADADAERSDVFAIPNVLAGEHSLKLVRDGYVEYARTVKVTELKTSAVNARLKRFFKPDVAITTETGTFRGVLVKNTSETVTIEVALGVMRTFERTQVRKLEFLDDAAKPSEAKDASAGGKDAAAK